MTNRFVHLLKATILSMLFFFSTIAIQLLYGLQTTSGTWLKLKLYIPLYCYNMFCMDECEIHHGWNVENLMLNCLIFWITTLIGYFGWKWWTRRA